MCVCVEGVRLCVNEKSASSANVTCLPSKRPKIILIMCQSDATRPGEDSGMEGGEVLPWNKVSKWACRWNVPAMKWLPLPRAELSPALQSERLLVLLPRSLSLCLSLHFFLCLSASLTLCVSFRTFIFLLCCSLLRSFGSFHAFRPFSFATPPFPVSFPWACFATSFCAFLFCCLSKLIHCFVLPFYAKAETVDFNCVLNYVSKVFYIYFSRKTFDGFLSATCI